MPISTSIEISILMLRILLFCHCFGILISIVESNKAFYNYIFKRLILTQKTTRTTQDELTYTYYKGGSQLKKNPFKKLTLKRNCQKKTLHYIHTL